MIADEHAPTAEALGRLLSAEFHVVDVVHDGRILVAEAVALRPDVLCLDLGMPGLNGLHAARELKKLLPNTKVIFVTQQVDAQYLRAAFTAGAVGFVDKQRAADELATAIHQVLDGGQYVTPSLAREALALETAHG